MILNIYNVRDERQGVYGTPVFTAKTGEQVSQDYEETIKHLQATIERYGEVGLSEKAAELLLRSASLKDTVVYHSGQFDTATGKITQVEPVLVCRVSDFFREVAKNA